MFRASLISAIFLGSIAFARPQPLETQDSGGNPPCAELGVESDYKFQRPSIPSSGMDTTAQWDNPGTPTKEEGVPAVFEHDSLSPNDAMGTPEATASPDEVNVKIKNEGGKLSGPNGDIVNGGLEGSCIEVQVRWTYWYQKTVTVSSTSGIDWIIHLTTTVSETRNIWVSEDIYAPVPPVVICPCD
jgi:hypothetical protein